MPWLASKAVKEDRLTAMLIPASYRAAAEVSLAGVAALATELEEGTAVSPKQHEVAMRSNDEFQWHASGGEAAPLCCGRAALRRAGEPHAEPASC